MPRVVQRVRVVRLLRSLRNVHEVVAKYRLVDERAAGGQVDPTHALSHAFRVFFHFFADAGTHREIVL